MNNIKYVTVTNGRFDVEKTNPYDKRVCGLYMLGNDPKHPELVEYQYFSNNSWPQPTDEWINNNCPDVEPYAKHNTKFGATVYVRDIPRIYHAVGTYTLSNLDESIMSYRLYAYGEKASIRCIDGGFMVVHLFATCYYKDIVEALQRTLDILFQGKNGFTIVSELL